MPDILDIGYKLAKLDKGKGGFPLSPSHGDAFYRTDLNRYFTFLSQYQWGKGAWVTEPKPFVIPNEQSWSTFPLAAGSYSSGYHAPEGGAYLDSNPRFPYQSLAVALGPATLQTYHGTAQSGSVYWNWGLNHGNQDNTNITLWAGNTQAATVISQWYRSEYFPSTNTVVPRNQMGYLFLTLSVGGGAPGNLWLRSPVVQYMEVGPSVPEEISGLTWWFNPSMNQWIYGFTGSVGYQVDSGNKTGRANLRQATAANQPTYQAHSSGMPLLRFDGSNDFMVADQPYDSSLNISTPSVFAVVKCNANTSPAADTRQAIVGKVDNSVTTDFRHKLLLVKDYNGTNPTLRWWAGDASKFVEVAQPAITDGNYHVVGAVSRAANDHSLYFDSSTTNFSTTLNHTSFNTAQLSMGSSFYTASTNPWYGDIAEVIIYNRALTSSETARVQAYLKAKWGTP